MRQTLATTPTAIPVPGPQALATPSARIPAVLGSALGLIAVAVTIAVAQQLARAHGLPHHPGIVPMAFVVALYVGAGGFIGTLAAPTSTGQGGPAGP